MMNRTLRALTLSLLLVALFVPFTASVTSAHGHLEVGKYELVIGFKTEPAYQGQPNGLDLRVTNKETGQSVAGLADTLKAELLFGSSKKELSIRPQWGVDGAYTADVVPTEAGDYTWRIVGTIEGTPVDVSMTSSPETFNSVQTLASVAFPAADPTAAELRAEAGAAAQTALVVGIVGVVLGIAGLVAGFLGIRAGRAAAPPVAGQAQSAAGQGD